MPDITDGLNELEFLASKAAAGKLIIVSGTTTSTGSVCSYTPANGATFILYKASVRMSSGSSNTGFTSQLRNNGTVLETIYGGTGTINGVPSSPEFIIKGDQLIGDGSKKYDINISAISSAGIAGTIIGYLL